MDNVFNEHDNAISEGAHQQRIHQQTNHPTNCHHEAGMHSEAACSTTTKRRTNANDQHVTTYIDMSPGGNSGNTNSAPSIKHTFACTSVSFTTTSTVPRIPGSRDATTTTLTRHGSTHMMHHTTGERGSPSVGSHGCRYRQTPQPHIRNPCMDGINLNCYYLHI